MIRFYFKTLIDVITINSTNYVTPFFIQFPLRKFGTIWK